MKTCLILLFVCSVAYAQTNFFKIRDHSFGNTGKSSSPSSSGSSGFSGSSGSFSGSSSSGSSRSFSGSSPSGSSGRSRANPRIESLSRIGNEKKSSRSSTSAAADASVDGTLGGSEYHYSWRHTGPHTKWEWGGAVGYCTALPGGWEPVSINDESENSFVTRVIGGDNVDYIWTGGRRSGSGWKWPKGQFKNIAWSHTGGFRRPQPDNREGNEDCLSVLNNIYGDGIVWHDVGCSHRKPIICERPARS